MQTYVIPCNKCYSEGQHRFPSGRLYGRDSSWAKSLSISRNCQVKMWLESYWLSMCLSLYLGMDTDSNTCIWLNIMVLSYDIMLTRSLIHNASSVKLHRGQGHARHPDGYRSSCIDWKRRCKGPRGHEITCSTQMSLSYSWHSFSDKRPCSLGDLAPLLCLIKGLFLMLN